MKTFFISIFLFLFSQTSFSQIQPDERLFVKFSSSKISQLQTIQSSLLKFWNFYLDECYIVLDVGEKALEYPDLYDIPNVNPNTGQVYNVTSEIPSNSSFNPFKFNIDFNLNKRKGYKFNDHQIVIFLSKDEIMSNYNKVI